MLKAKPMLNCHSCSGRAKSIFCNLTKEAVGLLDSGKNANIYKKGQSLFIEGNPPFGLYCLHSGKIKITKTNAEGKETIVRLASQGDVLGHRSLFSDSPYTASATVIEESIVCFVSKKTIMELIKQDPSLSFEIMTKISLQMGAAEERVASLSQKSQRERFAELLLLLKESYGERGEDGRIRLDIKLTREEMASMIGAASENLIRLVSEFKRDGIIEQEGKVLYLVDITEIEKKANLGY